MSAPVILAAQAPRPPEEFPRPVLLEAQLVGWDDTEWDLSNPAGGVFLGEGVSGLLAPPIERTEDVTPYLDGSRTQFVRSGNRTMVLPVGVYHPAAGQDWVDLNAAWWKVWRKGKINTLTITAPNRTRRQVQLQLVDHGNPAFTKDPLLRGWQLYALTVIAEQPFWVGSSQRASFTQSPGVDKYGGGPLGSPSVKGPPFVRGSNRLLETAVMDNPGDTDAWPVWTVFGPCTEVTVGVGEHLVSAAITLDAGESLVIDGRPDFCGAYDFEGTDRTNELTSWDFAPIPAGISVPLSLTMTGPGSVVVELDPLYELFG